MGLGMGYAAALMAAGWYQYRRSSSLAPVFVACGAILMSSIVVETHARFGSLPLVPAYWTLMATGAALAFVSRQFSVFLPVSVGTLGMCLAGAAIDYPDPFFPYLFMVLLTANLLGYYAGTLKRCGWLRWTVLLVTLAMFLLWGMRLAAVAARKNDPAPTLAPEWFLPVLAAVGVVFLAIALLGIVRSRREKLSAFDFCLPTINAVGSYLAARVVVRRDRRKRPRAQPGGDPVRPRPLRGRLRTRDAKNRGSPRHQFLRRRRERPPGAGPPRRPRQRVGRRPRAGGRGRGRGRPLRPMGERRDPGNLLPAPGLRRRVPGARFPDPRYSPHRPWPERSPAPRWPRSPWSITGGADATPRPPAPPCSRPTTRRI